jgi:hypothetical protein
MSHVRRPAAFPSLTARNDPQQTFPPEPFITQFVTRFATADHAANYKPLNSFVPEFKGTNL